MATALTEGCAAGLFAGAISFAAGALVAMLTINARGENQNPLSRTYAAVSPASPSSPGWISA